MLTICRLLAKIQVVFSSIVFLCCLLERSYNLIILKLLHLSLSLFLTDLLSEELNLLK